jgi:hypothetical protein
MTSMRFHSFRELDRLTAVRRRPASAHEAAKGLGSRRQTVVHPASVRRPTRRTMAQRPAAPRPPESQSAGVRGIPRSHSRRAPGGAGSGARAGALVGGVFGLLSWPDQPWGILVPIGCGLIVGAIVGALSGLAMAASHAAWHSTRSRKLGLKPNV